MPLGRFTNFEEPDLPLRVSEREVREVGGVSRCTQRSLAQHGGGQGSAWGLKTHSAGAAGLELGPAASDGMQIPQAILPLAEPQTGQACT